MSLLNDMFIKKKFIILFTGLWSDVFNEIY